jgi:methyltransferase (TIGR00027 family)
MLMKIGALSRQTGLTVRTLHHYDAMGLLGPSHRSESGYRLYTEADVIRLHRIQTLKQMGCSLAEIKQALDGPDCSGQDMVSRQVQALREQQRQLAALLDRLERLQRKMDLGGQAAVSDWLAVLEMMMLQEKHLTPQEMAQLQTVEDKAGAALDARWAAMVGAVSQAMSEGVPPESARAQQLAWDWIRLGNDTVHGDTRLAMGLTRIQQREPRAQAINGITVAVMDWVTTAFAHARASLMAPYMTAQELEQVRTRMVATMADWPPLFAEARQLMDKGLAPSDPAAADLARRWEALFRAAHSGGDEALEAKVRQAFDNEPDLLVGMGLNVSVLAFMRTAITLLSQPLLADAAPAAVEAPKPTAYMTATMRAMHQLVDAPLVFRDPLAVAMLGPDAEQALLAQRERHRDPMLAAVRAAVVVRSRVTANAWAQAFERGVRQHVVLGAGLDTFAYRQSEGFDAQVFEVDLPATQQWKRECLEAAGIDVPPWLRFVPVDFQQSTLAEGLARAGFRRDEPAFFSWLGVTIYLDEAAIWQTLDFIASCPAGTGVVFDFVMSPALMQPMERVGWEVVAAQVAARGEPFKSHFDPAALQAAMRARGFGSVAALDGPLLNELYIDARLRASGLSVRPSQWMMRAWV